MSGSNDSKSSPKNQDTNSLPTDYQPVATSAGDHLVPRTFEGKEYYATADVAKIIGVTKQAVEKWRNQNLFTADIRTHDGIYLYEIERVMQLKAVYHPKWTRGGYEPSPTTANSVSNPAPNKDDFMTPVSSPAVIVKKRNVQIYPSKKLVFPNDCFSKRLFNLTDDDYQKALEERKVLQVNEKRNHSKFGDIFSPFRIRVDDQNDFTLSEPIDQFHFAILCACISEWNAGNRYTTPSIIYRAVTGKVGRGDAEPSKDQLADILAAIDKLMRTQIAINMSDTCQNLKYNSGNAYKIISSILPCERITETAVNGKEATVIYFDRVSPLWKIASNVKGGQILSCDSALLNVPNQQNTRMNIAVKTYVLRRVLEILAHPKQMVPIITFADVFQKCRLESVSRKKKLDVRETILVFFKHLEAQGLVEASQLNNRGARPYSVSFTRPKK